MNTRQKMKSREVVENEELPTKVEVNPTTASKSIQDGNQALVFDLVIRSMKCPRLLRKCRLVCKAWNESACPQLKSVATTPVTMSENERYGTKSLASLQRADCGLKSDGSLPGPFRKVALRIARNEDQLFLNNNFTRCLGNDLVLTELHLDGCSFWKMKKILTSILKSQSRSLQVLTINNAFLDEGEFCQNTQVDMQEIQFPSLKKIMFAALSSELKFWKLLIQTIVLKSKLELLELKCLELNQLHPLFKGFNFDRVDKLEVGTFYFNQHIKSPDVMRLFAIKPWPNLMQLIISVSTEQDVAEIVSWLNESLEMLQIHFAKIPLDDLPKCPKLRDIRSASGYSGQLLPEKFPALNKFYSGRSLPWSDLEKIVPHYGVVQAKIEVKCSSQHEESRDCHFCNKWESWADDFPEVKTYFHEHQARFCKVSTALRTITKSFPNLKTLTFVEDSEKVLRLVPSKSHCKSYRREDILKLPLDLFIQEVFPFEDLLELESLDLSSVEVNSGLVISSVSKIPKLKYLRFKKHRELTSEIVRDYLAHLMEIVFQNCGDFHRSGCTLAEEQRDRMREIEIPLIKLYCTCPLCENPLCGCQDCQKYTWQN